jgi:hypothetical protein
MAAEQDNAAVVRRFWDRVWNNGELPAIEGLDSTLAGQRCFPSFPR